MLMRRKSHAVALLLSFNVLAATSALSGEPASDRQGEHRSAGRDVGSQEEKDWVDNRWSRTEVGQFLASLVDAPGGVVAKGLSIKVGERDEGTVCFDTANLSWRAAWTGGFLKFDAARFGLIKVPKVDGAVAFRTASGPAWLSTSNRFSGLHLNGKRVVLEYTVGGVRVLDSPWLERPHGLIMFSRSLELAPSDREMRLVAATVDNKEVAFATTEKWAKASGGSIERRWSIMAVGSGTKLTNDGAKIIVSIPPHSAAERVQLLLWSGSVYEVAAFARFETELSQVEDVASLAKPGPARWLPDLKTTGQRGLDTDILAVDTLTVPYDNPWKALMFLAGVDFTPDGAIWVCSIHGDVWRVTGADDGLRDLRWKRFATGLFQPLGLKVRDGKVFVLGRDQITRLHDLNGDGEADFYENFCGLLDTSTGTHDFATCLEQDTAGNFYYVDPRGVHRVSADGQRKETIASGWRFANSLGVSPDGAIVTVSPQQGEWTPSSQISEAKPGGYYGYGGPKVTPERPLGYDAPLCWIPHGVDNSSASRVWVPRGQWGPLSEHMVHLLWGRCGLMLVLRDVVDGVPQGAVLPLPGRLLSGPNRGTFNSRDGHLYIAASTGWQTSAAKDGALQRVRFTGKPVFLPVAWHAHSNGLAITFSQPLERASAEDAGSFGVAQWNYRYAAQYGSKDWSVANPEKPGRDEVEVKSARLLPDGKTVFLEMPALRPVMQMEVKYSLSNAEGNPARSQLWLTLNKLDADRR